MTITTSWNQISNLLLLTCVLALPVATGCTPDEPADGEGGTETETGGQNQEACFEFNVATCDNAKCSGPTALSAMLINCGPSEATLVTPVDCLATFELLDTDGVVADASTDPCNEVETEWVVPAGETLEWPMMGSGDPLPVGSYNGTVTFNDPDMSTVETSFLVTE